MPRRKSPEQTLTPLELEIMNVLWETGPANVARLWLCAATRQVLANGLAVLGVDAPERM